MTDGGAWVAVESEIDDAAVVAFAQLVAFVGDSNGQGMLLFRLESFAQDVDPVQVQFEAVLGNKQILFRPIGAIDASSVIFEFANGTL